MNVTREKLFEVLEELNIPTFYMSVPDNQKTYPYITVLDNRFGSLINASEDYGMLVTYEISLHTKNPREKLMELRDKIKNKLHRDEDIIASFNKETRVFEYYLFLEVIETWPSEYL